MPKVYVSSTFSDLKEHRERVDLALRRLRVGTVAMETYVAEPARPLDRCLADVRECDLYVGIFAWHYGSRPPGSDISYTEHEYREAVAAGKPRLIFLLAEDAPWPRTAMDFGTDGEEIERLRRELAGEQLVSRFHDAGELAELVSTAASNWLRGIAATPSSLGVIDAPTLSRYYRRLHQAYGRLELDALTPPQQEEYLQIQLAQVFTEQDVRENPPPVELPKELWQKLHADREVDASDLPAGYDVEDIRRAREAYLRKEPRPVLDVLADPQARTVVLLGDPGAGKSTVARFLTLALASSTPHPRLAPLTGSLPLLVELKKFIGLRTAGRCDTFLDFLHRIAVEEGLGIEQQLLTPYLENGGAAVVVFDGLDEVFDPAERAATSRAIAGFADRYPGVRVVVTSRIIGYSRSTLGSAGFGHFTLQELGERQVEDFLATWYGLALHDRPDDARVRRERLLEAVRSSRPIRELTGNPLLLTIMAIIGKHQELPRERWRLYDHAATVLVQHWDVNRLLRDARVSADFIDEQDKKELLRRLAYRMQTGDDRATGGNFINGDELRSVIETYLAERYRRDPAEAKAIAISMINQFRERNFVLSRYGPDLFSFVHRTFLEFFCADHVVTRFQRDQELTFDDLRRLVDTHWQDPSWREVLRLVCSNIAERFAGELVTHLVDEVNRPWETGRFERTPWNIALAILCLAEVRNLHAVAGPAERLLDALILLIEHDVGRGTEIDFLQSDEVLTAIAAIGPGWPGRERYLDWYRRRGGRITWTPLAEVAGDVLARLFAEDPRVVSALANGAGTHSDPFTPRSYGANLAGIVRPGSDSALVTAVLAAIEGAAPRARQAFIDALHPGAAGDPHLRSFLFRIVEAETDVDAVESAARHLFDSGEASVLDLVDDRARSEPDHTRSPRLGGVLLEHRPPDEIRRRLLDGTATGFGALHVWRRHWPEEALPDEVLHRIARTADWDDRLEALTELLRRDPHTDAVDDLVHHVLEHDDDDEMFETAARHLLARGRAEQVAATARRRLPDDDDDDVLLHGAVTWALRAASWAQDAGRTASIIAHTTDAEEVNRALGAISRDVGANAPILLLGGTIEKAYGSRWRWFPSRTRGWTSPQREDTVLEELLARRPDGVRRIAWGARVLDDWRARGACLTVLFRLRPDAPETIDTARHCVADEPDVFLAQIAASYLLAGGRADEDTIGLLLRRATQAGDRYLRNALCRAIEDERGPSSAGRLLGACIASGEFARYRSDSELEDALLAAHAELTDSSAVREYTGAGHPAAVRVEAMALLHRRGSPEPGAGAALRKLVTELSATPDDDPQLLVRCLQVLCGLASDDQDAYELVRSTAREGPNAAVREEATRLLAVFRAARPTDLPDADGDIPST